MYDPYKACKWIFKEANKIEFKRIKPSFPRGAFKWSAGEDILKAAQDFQKEPLEEEYLVIYLRCLQGKDKRWKWANKEDIDLHSSWDR